MHILPRSHLYSLEPVENCSPQREGAGSYLTRLAMEHCVSPQEIINEILHLLGEESKYIAQREYSSVLYLLNGMGPFAKKWIDAIEELTGRHDLKSLTLLNWGGIIRPTELIRKHKAWCPQCLSEWQKNKREIFEPLLWSLSQVTVCPKHRIHLLQKCPNDKCNHSIPTLGSRSRPGNCSFCNTWLGDSPSSALEVSQEDLWTAEIIQEMLRYNHNPGKLTFETNGQQVIRLFEPGGTFDKARITFLASIFGVHPTTINRWKRGENPSLPILLRGCYLLQLSPFKFSSGEIDEAAVQDFLLKEALLTEAESTLIDLFTKDKKGFQQKYGVAISSSKSASDFFRRIKVRESVVNAKCPRFSDFVVKTMRRGKTSMEREIRSLLNSYLCLEPPRTLSAVSKEIGIPLRTLRRYEPSSCKNIAQRCIEYESKLSNEKEEDMISRVYDATTKSLTLGIDPSPEIISSSLPHKAYMRNPRIREAMKQASIDFANQT